MPLFDEHLTIIARLGHPLAEGRASLEALVGKTWVGGPTAHRLASSVRNSSWRAASPPPAQICEMVTFPLAEKLVMGSDAIGLLTYSSRQKRSLQDRLTIVSSEFPEAVRQIGITLPAGQSLSLPQDLFLQMLGRWLPSHG